MITLPKHWTEHCYECGHPTEHVDTDEYELIVSNAAGATRRVGL